MELTDNLFFLGQIVLQPTTLCNLNCTYCYLPDRNKALFMAPTITERLAEDIEAMDMEYTIQLVWHGGEPLSCGLEHFSKLIEPLHELNKAKKISHGIQTNGTLINQDWCEFFIEHQFEVGVSIDGPKELNKSRLYWSGNESFAKTKQGIEMLASTGIPFTVISVVSSNNLPRPKDLYEFVSNLECESVGINIEEKIGINTSLIDNTAGVAKFWTDLFDAWKENPKIRIREFKNILYWMSSVVGDKPKIPDKIDIFPTIGWNGDVVLLSPELLGAKSITYEDFKTGNICSENLWDIINDSHRLKYVSDYKAGVVRCERECPYFSYCRGGQAANKFFETTKINTTETLHCKNSQQIPLMVIQKSLDNINMRASVQQAREWR